MKHLYHFFFCSLLLITPLFSEEVYIPEAPSQDYEAEFIELVEMIYGEGILSQGGLYSIDKMFSGIDLDGLTMLDLGSGLGMHDIYLATQNQVDIVGVDPQPYMVNRARDNLAKHQDELVGSVSFLLMDNSISLSQFDDETFDVVFSKEAILHVPCAVKQAYFNEVFRVLKSGGRIVIMDWMRSGPTYSDNTIKMMEMDGIVYELITPGEYTSILSVAGFRDIIVTDTTAAHAEFSQQNIDTICDLSDQIIARFGYETYSYCLESWALQRDAFKTRDILTGIFKASKP